MSTYWNYFSVLIGAVAAVTAESIYRQHHGPFSQVFVLSLLLAAIIQYAVYVTMRMSTSLIDGIVVWATFTAALRILATLFVLGEAVLPASWVAFGLLVLGQFIRYFWR